MANPRLIVRMICQLVESKEAGVSNSEQVFHDYYKALDAMCIVNLANGDIVAEIADRNKDCCSKYGTGKHGGVRKKGT